MADVEGWELLLSTIEVALGAGSFAPTSTQP